MATVSAPRSPHRRRSSRVVVTRTVVPDPNSCGCTDAERLGNGRTTRVYIDGAPVDLCQGCAVDRLKEHWAPNGWRSPIDDANQRAYDRGTNAIRGGFGVSVVPRYR